MCVRAPPPSAHESGIVLDYEILLPLLDYPDPFHPHNELKYQIKLALKPSGRADPVVRIEIPFDFYTFMGVMRRAGKMKRKSNGSDVYGIDGYSALVPILGERWHIRILNEDKDFCYVVHSTVEYYLYRRKPLIDSYEPLHAVDGGYCLIFRFVRGDGVESTLDRITSML